MIFENKICDGCKKAFEKDDDVVVCPECGTPQHRSCFEENGGCVNSSKHAEGFSWQKEEQPEVGEEKNGEEIGFDRNGDGLGELQNKKGIFGNMDPGVGDNFDMDSEVPDLDQLIESRVQALAPGITPEQRREQLCGEELGRTISFVGSNASSYIKKFRKREHEGKHTFNWAAFFFSPVWFFYRKLYKVGAVYVSLFVSLTLLMQNPAEDFMAAYKSLAQMSAEMITEADIMSLSKLALPVFGFMVAEFVIRLVAGFTADKMYWKHCRKSLEKVKFLQAERDDVSALSYYLSRCSTSFLVTLAAILVYLFLPQLLLSLF